MLSDTKPSFPCSTNSQPQVSDPFYTRHIGPREHEIEAMLNTLGCKSLSELIDKTVPTSIKTREPLALGEAKSEHQALTLLKNIAKQNQIFKNYIGLGYHPTLTPAVIERNVLQNPGWYTAYTPYQAEISQGRLEGLLNFQQMIIDLCGMEMANASLLDEATAAAEAMAAAKRCCKNKSANTFFVADSVLPQTLAVIETRARHFGFEIVVGNPFKQKLPSNVFGVLLQYPGMNGEVFDLTPVIDQGHAQQALVTVAADLLSLVLLKSPGAMGADFVIGSSQRFGVPMGYGGPHAAFFAFREEHKRQVPGRIIGLSKDSNGNPALRMAMQTREQHIRREKATSNICTAQVLLALISAFYALYHGPQGLQRIAQRIHDYAKQLATQLQSIELGVVHSQFFDTLLIEVGQRQQGIFQRALDNKINVRKVGATQIAVSLNEATTAEDLQELLACFGSNYAEPFNTSKTNFELETGLLRQDTILSHPVFNQFHSETAMMRYLHQLETKDIALNQSMIPLGSCTMKLNAAAEMIPISWPEFSHLHPFCPREQARGYQQLISELETMLQACTGYAAVSLQPNAGSQGEYAGLLAIKNYFSSRNEKERQYCLIPTSAHGTNPASAQMAGLEVIQVQCDKLGNIDFEDLTTKVAQYSHKIAAIMLTYPSTHGVYEDRITDICNLIHSVGAQVYIDGANLNALVGVAAPGQFGGDVSHLNLHKTFCIPHGGGGPGVGPVAVAAHLKNFLPAHPFIDHQNSYSETIAAAPWGSAGILPISWMYITMMGAEGLRRATEIAVLNANYIARQLATHFPILYKGKNGLVAHECIIDLRPLTKVSGISEEDVAKRLMDYSFHSPTMSFPVAGTLMIEPTESESKTEMDRFIAAMLNIRQEIEAVIQAKYSLADNPLVNAPHTLQDILSDNWSHPYSREVAATPLPYLKQHKYWPPVNRVDSAYGDRYFCCSWQGN